MLRLIYARHATDDVERYPFPLTAERAERLAEEFRALGYAYVSTYRI